MPTTIAFSWLSRSLSLSYRLSAGIHFPVTMIFLRSSGDRRKYFPYAPFLYGHRANLRGKSMAKPLWGQTSPLSRTRIRSILRISPQNVSGDLPERSHTGSSQRKAKRFLKCDWRRRCEAHMVRRLRKYQSVLDDLVELVGNPPLIKIKGGWQGVMSIREGARLLFLRTHPEEWPSLAKSISFDVDHWLCPDSPPQYNWQDNLSRYLIEATGCLTFLKKYLLPKNNLNAVAINQPYLA